MTAVLPILITFIFSCKLSLYPACLVKRIRSVFSYPRKAKSWMHLQPYRDGTSSVSAPETDSACRSLCQTTEHCTLTQPLLQTQIHHLSRLLPENGGLPHTAHPTYAITSSSHEPAHYRVPDTSRSTTTNITSPSSLNPPQHRTPRDPLLPI